jgi:hypothetical protein
MHLAIYVENSPSSDMHCICTRPYISLVKQQSEANNIIYFFFHWKFWAFNLQLQIILGSPRRKLSESWLYEKSLQKDSLKISPYESSKN